MLPQPVYMNMGDLAQMAAARAGSLRNSSPDCRAAGGGGGGGAICEEDESPELKTPTADQHGMIPGTAAAAAAASNQAVAGTKVNSVVVKMVQNPDLKPL